MPDLSDADRLMLNVVVRELRVLAAADPEVRSAPAMAAQLLETLVTPDARAEPDATRRLDPEAFAQYLVAQGLVPAGARVKLRRTALGFSKDTYLVSLDDDPAPVLAARLDLRASAVRSTVADEFPLLQAVHAAGFQVAEPLKLETDRSLFGRPFIVMRAVGGQAGHEVATDSAEQGKAVGLELAGLVARMHALDPERIGAGWSEPAADPAEEIRRYFRSWLAIWDEVGRGEFPEVDRAYAYLLEVPYAPEQLSLVHGDIDFHNILVDSSGVTAVLDWEFAHWGDAAEDLGYCRRPVERRMDWAEFLAAYEVAGGRPVSEERIRFYDFWRMVRTATTCAIARQSFESGANSDLRMAFAGRILLAEWVGKVKAAVSELG